MAEGWSEDINQTSIDSGLLECPICLEQLRTPKSLPCLHSFCQECLGSYITKELSGLKTSSFSCPVCRKTTNPLNASEDITCWAKQFPTNNLATEMIQLKNKLDEPYKCMLCQKRGNMETPAVFWCKFLNTLLCEACKESHHDIIHDKCDIRSITKGFTLALSQESITIRCEKHRKKMEYFCEDHQFIGCSKCITIDHRRCEVVTTTEEYCEKLTNSSQLSERVELLQKSDDSLELLLKNFDEQLEALANDRETALKSISDLREKINQFLDKKQQEITDELISKIKDENNKLDASRRKCERLKVSTSKTLEASKLAVLNKNDLETIVLYQRGQAEIESCKQLLEEMRKSYTSFRIYHVTSQDDIPVGYDHAISMGKITLEQSPRDLSASPTFGSLSGRHVKAVRSINIKCPSDKKDCCSCGVALLPSGHIVLSDKNNSKLKLFSETGVYLDAMEVTGNLYDMCLVDDTTVAAAVTSKNCVYVVKVQSSKLSMAHKITPNDPPDLTGCYSITYTGERFIVSRNGNFYSLSIEGHAKEIYFGKPCCHHVFDKTQGWSYMSSYTETKQGEIAVYRLTKGKATCILQNGVVTKAFGIDVDREGNVYVCGRASNNVIQMSGDGTNVRELLTSSDGVEKPRAIAVCSDKFVVTNESSTQRNYIHLFQLN